MACRQPGLGNILKKIITPSISKVDREWFLELDKTYSLCGHSQTWQHRYMSRKLFNQALKENPGYRLKTTKDNLQVYAMQIPDFCAGCRNKQFLGIRDQQVAIIRGTPEKPGPVLEKTNIKITDLPKSELEDLQKGIPFKNNKEKLQLIEGLSAD